MKPIRWKDTWSTTHDILGFIFTPDRVKNYIIHLAWAFVVMCASVPFFAGALYLVRSTQGNLLTDAQINPVYLFGVMYGCSLLIYFVSMMVSLVMLSTPERLRVTLPHVLKNGVWMMLVGAVLVVCVTSVVIFSFAYMLYSTHGDSSLPAKISELYMNQLVSVSYVALPLATYFGYHRAYYMYRLFGALSPEDHVKLRDRENYGRLYDWQWTRMAKFFKWLLGKRTYTPSYAFFTLILIIVPLTGVGVWSASLVDHVFSQAFILGFFICVSVVCVATNAKMFDRYREWSLKKPRLEWADTPASRVLPTV